MGTAQKAAPFCFYRNVIPDPFWQHSISKILFVLAGIICAKYRWCQLFSPVSAMTSPFSYWAKLNQNRPIFVRTKQIKRPKCWFSTTSDVIVAEAGYSRSLRIPIKSEIRKLENTVKGRITVPHLSQLLKLTIWSICLIVCGLHLFLAEQTYILVSLICPHPTLWWASTGH